MRAFEFQAGELIDPDDRSRRMIVDLDAIVRCASRLDAIGREGFYVVFSDGDHLWVTQPAFDKVLLAWKSK